MNINWITPVRGGRGRAAKDAAIVVSPHSINKGESQRTSITIYESLMKEMRFIAGDRVQIGTNDTHIAIRRVKDGGYTLSPRVSGGVEEAAGKPVTCVVNISENIANEKRSFNREQIEVTDEGFILIPFETFNLKGSKHE